MSGAFEIADLRVTRRGHETLRLEALSLKPGQVVGVMGPSGSGKSTLARALIGLPDADEAVTGRFLLEGRDLAPADFAALRGNSIGLIAQDPLASFNPFMRVGDHAVEAIRWHLKLSKAEAFVATQAAFARVGLPSEAAFLRRFPHQLSGGQRQRAAIAAAIALKPRWLIADEATSMLDVISQDQVARLLSGLAREDNIGLVMISHDLALLGRHADALIVLEAGKVVEAGETKRLFANPQHIITKAMLAAVRLPLRPPAEPLKTAPILEAHAVTRRYPGALQPAVKAVGFTLRKGEAIGIVGESGSGKSTLARTLLALDVAQGGEVRLDGAVFAANRRQGDLRAQRARIQAVFQDPSASFDPLWTVARIVAEPLYLLNVPPAPQDVAARVAEVLALVGLAPEMASRLPHQFSGGQKQKIAIARALILKPDIIVLDEAVSALDTVSRNDVLALLSDLKARLDLSLIFVSHDLNAVRALCEQVLILKGGEAVEQGAASDIFANPKHGYTRELIAATPVI
jgi:peptide/nickel transport system ATP-binding protein